MLKNNAIKSRVFILQKQSKYDVSQVKDYSSDFIYIIEKEHINPFDTYELIELIRHRLIVEHFDSEKDFVCLTGSSVLLSLFLAILVRNFSCYDVFKILIFDAKTNKYKLRLLSFK